MIKFKTYLAIPTFAFASIVFAPLGPYFDAKSDAQTVMAPSKTEQPSRASLKSARRSGQQQSITPTVQTNNPRPVLNDNAGLNAKSRNSASSRKNRNSRRRQISDPPQSRPQQTPLQPNLAPLRPLVETATPPASDLQTKSEAGLASTIPINLRSGSIPRRVQPLLPNNQLSSRSVELKHSRANAAVPMGNGLDMPHAKATQASFATPLATQNFDNQTRRISSEVSSSNASFAAEPSAAQSPKSERSMRRTGYIAPVPKNLVQDDESLREADTSGTESENTEDDESFSENDEAAEIEAEAIRLRAGYANELNQPLSQQPVQRALEYKDETGVSLDAQYAVSNFRSFVQQPLQTETTRRAMNGQYWLSSYATWRSPNFAHRPLYFEDANLERFGGEKRRQAMFSAAHFFASAITLPYQIAQKHPCDMYYTSGYGRPGNDYCLRCRKPQWDREGLTLQGLITTAIIFGIL